MPKKPKTGTLPGMPERKTIKLIETLAADYVEQRDARMAAGKLEVEAKKKLIDALHKHEITDYDFEDGDDSYTIELKPKEEKLKVKKNADSGDEGEE